MRARRGSSWLAAVVALVAVEPREARACAPPEGGPWARRVLPEDGATGVPRNARILVEYDTYAGDPGGALELRAQGGATVAVTTTTPGTLGFARLLTPTEPLAASTTYEVLDTVTVPCEDTACLGEAAVIATFTTGAALDATPPQLVGVSVRSSFSCVSDSCPEGENEQIDVIAIDSVVDDSPTSWIRYEYLALDGAVLAGPTPIRVLGRGCGGGAGYFPLLVYLPLPSTVDLRAVDLAGNVEAPVHRIEGGSCALVECDPDAGVPGGDAGGDAGGGDAGNGGGGGADDDAGGCGCASGGDRSALGLVLVVAFALARRRRYGASTAHARPRSSPTW